jgi:hypothetical protein
MDNKKTSKHEDGQQQDIRSFELYNQALTGRNIVMRDDQVGFYWLLDSIKACRKNRSRFRLIDSGRWDVYQMEWISEAGADIYTSNSVRKEVQDFMLLARATGKGNGVIAYRHQGVLEKEPKEKTLSIMELKDVGRMGVDIHVSNKENAHEFPGLYELAHECRKGRGRFVYYHHGMMDPALENLALCGAWIHISDDQLQEEKDTAKLIEIIRAARLNGANLFLHAGRRWKRSWLEDIFKEKAYVVMKTPPSDYRSAYRIFERKAEEQEFDFRTCYIYANLMI